jgi:hypothetical protein
VVIVDRYVFRIPDVTASPVFLNYIISQQYAIKTFTICVIEEADFGI